MPRGNPAVGDVVQSLRGGPGRLKGRITFVPSSNVSPLDVTMANGRHSVRQNSESLDYLDAPLPTIRFLAGRWDGNLPENVDRGWIGATLRTTYGYRQPSLPGVGAYWDQTNVDPPGGPFTVEQARMDAEINCAADHGWDGWVFLWYPTVANGTTEIFVGADRRMQSDPAGTTLPDVWIAWPHFTNSDDFSQASWTKTGTTITGTNEINETAANSVHTVSQDVTNVGAMAPIIVSFDVEAGPGTVDRDFIYWEGNAVAGTARAVFRISTATVFSTTNCTATITVLGNGRRRCQMSYTRQTGPCTIGLSPDGTTFSYVGDTNADVLVYNATVRTVQNPAPIWLDILTGGGLGVATFRWSLDEGVTWQSSLTVAATVDLGTTGVKIIFSNAIYSSANAYRAITYNGDIHKVFLRYNSSSLKSRLKFAWMFSTTQMSYPNDSWLNFDAYVAYIVSFMSDAQYVRVTGNKPLVYLLQSTDGLLDWPAARVTTITNAVVAAGIPSPYYVLVNGDDAQATAIGAQARMLYGIRQNFPPPATGRLAFGAQFSEDVAAIAAHSAVHDAMPNIMAICGDSRPQVFDCWIDRPCRTQAEAIYQWMLNWSIANLGGKSEGIVHQYAWDEISEGGDYIPTAQRGEMYVDCMLRVKQQSFPDKIYWDVFASTVITATRSGSWTEVQGIVGAWEYTVLRSSTANDYWEFTSGGDRTTSGFRIYARKGPDCGICEIIVNGASQGNFDLYAAVEAQGQLIFEITGLNTGSNTIRVRVTGTKNPSSSNFRVDLDQLWVQANWN